MRAGGGGGLRFSKPGKLASIIRILSKPMMMRACLQMGGGAAPAPPTPDHFFFAGKLASKLTNPFQTHDASIVFSNAAACAAPTGTKTLLVASHILRYHRELVSHVFLSHVFLIKYRGKL